MSIETILGDISIDGARLSPLQELAGGVGGRVWLANLVAADGTTARRVIAKLVTGQRASSAPTGEAATHERALAESPTAFRETHMVRLMCAPVRCTEGTVLIYDVAGDSMRRNAPLSVVTDVARVQATLSRLSKDILTSLNPALTLGPPVAPFEFLRRSLGFRLDRLSAVASKLLLGDQPESAANLRVGTAILPNPIAWLLNAAWWSGPAITPLVGRVHGDLHGGNIIIGASDPSGDDPNYWIIDLATWTTSDQVLFDQIYLEFSEALRLAPPASIADWVALCESLWDPSVRSPIALEGLQHLISKMRSDYRADLTIPEDLIEELSCLMAVSVGLNFACKRGMSDDHAQKGLIYSAVALKRLLVGRPGLDREGTTELRIPYALDDLAGVPEELTAVPDEAVWILLTDREALDNPLALHDGRWSLIFDLDRTTAIDGAYSLCAPLIEASMGLHLMTPEDDTPPFVLGRSCLWVAARGLENRPSLQTSDDWAVWRRNTASQLQRIASVVGRATTGRPVVVAVLVSDARFATTLVDALDMSFGATIRYAITDRLSALRPHLASLGCPISVVNATQLASWIQSEPRNVGDGSATPSLPSRDGRSELPPKDLHWIEEELEVLHSGAGLKEEPGRASGRDFLRGLPISWFELAVDADVPREVTRPVEARVREDLANNQNTQVNLYHYPGSGGSTAGKRVGWSLRNDYPVAVLKVVSPRGTLERVRALYRATNRTVFLIADSGTVQPEATRQLYTDLRADNIPAVILSVARRDEVGQGETGRTFFLPKTVTAKEANAFVAAYSRYVPRRAQDVERIVSVGSPALWMPFYFGLTAFREDFTRLDTFVLERLRGASDTQRLIIGLLGMVYHYAQRPVPSYVFAPLSPNSVSVKPDLQRVLSPLQLDLTVRDGIAWRPVHDLVGEAAMQRALAGVAAPDVRVWRDALVVWSKRFIELVANSRGPAGTSPELMDTLSRLFIDRDLEGSPAADASNYARIITDMSNDEARSQVFEALTDAFPGEAHFWAHRARFLASRLRRFEEAAECMRNSLRLDPNDHVLQHIDGMVSRAHAYSLMELGGTADPEGLEIAVDAALEAFGRARDLDPQAEHPYVSAVELLVRYVQHKASGANFGSTAEFLASADGRISRERLADAELLLSRVRRLREGRQLSHYVESLSPRLDQIYGDFAKAIERWNNLLSLPRVYRPPVRRSICYAYLARRQRSWASVPEREIDRILTLMSENLEEEPSDGRNIRLWFMAAKRSKHVAISAAIEQLTYWADRSEDIDAHYYLFCLYTILALRGDMLATDQADRHSARCRELAKGFTNRTTSFEWLGSGVNLEQLVSGSELGEFDQQRGFFPETSRLLRVRGTIASIRGPEAGTIELQSGQKTFFVPVRSRGESFERTQSENRTVYLYLGFSYDGLRAWEVNSAR